MCKGKEKREKREKRVTISTREIERVKKDLARVDALKKALGLKETPDNPLNDNPNRGTLDFSVLVYLKLGDLSGEIWWLLGLVTVTTGLLIAILTKVA